MAESIISELLSSNSEMISVETYKKFMPLSTKEKEKVLLSIDIDEAEKMLSNIDFNDYEQECAIEIPLY